MKSLIIAAIAAFSIGAQATTISSTVLKVNGELFINAPAGMNWVVGDTASYKMDIGGFIQGTMVMAVKSIDAKSLVITEDVDMMGQKEACEAALDPNTGKTQSLTCNGQAQSTDDGEIKVDNIKQESITVPAGTFQVMHVTAHTVKDNKKTEIWANPKLIPVAGMAKTTAETQFGQMTVELTSFKKN